MQVSPINNNNNPNFGHSFRVSICLKSENGLENIFVNPNTDKKLYKTLNSKIVGWLNEDYFENLRKIFGIQRKQMRREPYGDIHRNMAAELRKIDGDYALLSNVRSAYRKNQLGYILTGIDVPIAENVKGLKQIGVAKADSRLYYGDTHTSYIKNLVSAINGNVLDYVKNDNVLLRSPNNKEIMLKTIFKKTGVNKSGNPVYELDSYEFHENKTKRTLAPLSREFNYYKYGSGMRDEIQRTVENQVSKILKRRIHFNNINSVLNIKPAAPKAAEVKAASKPAAEKIAAEKPKVKQIKKTVQKAQTQKPAPKTAKQPVQLEFDFKD